MTGATFLPIKYFIFWRHRWKGEGSKQISNDVLISQQYEMGTKT